MPAKSLEWGVTRSCNARDGKCAMSEPVKDAVPVALRPGERVRHEWRAPARKQSRDCEA